MTMDYEMEQSMYTDTANDGLDVEGQQWHTSSKSLCNETRVLEIH